MDEITGTMSIRKSLHSLQRRNERKVELQGGIRGMNMNSSLGLRKGLRNFLHVAELEQMDEGKIDFENNIRCAFWKIVQPRNLPPYPLAIPRGFALGEFSKNSCSIVVVAPDETEWLMKIERHRGRLFITKGWSKFFHSFKIRSNFFLLFNYIGNRRFSVRIVTEYSVIRGKKKFYVEVDGKVPKPIVSSVLKSKVAGFFVSNFPPFEFGKIRIAKKFNELYGVFVPRDIVLVLDNGDNWSCVYDHKNHQIVGLEKFMDFYRIATYWFMVINYLGDCKFTANIFSPNCVEICYPKMLHPDVKVKGNELVDVQLFQNHGIIEEKSGALLFFNVSYNSSSFFKLVILSIHLNQQSDKVPVSEEMYHIFKSWTDCEKITLWLLEKKWEIEIEWSNDHCMFGTGWSKFVKDVQLCVGDTCIFECTANPFEYNICVSRHEHYDFIMTKTDLCGVKFFQIVFSHSLKEDRLVLPICCGEIFENFLLPFVKFIMPSNQTWSICYQGNPASFSLIKDFASFYDLKENFILLFEYLGESSFFVRIFDKNSMEIIYLKSRKAMKRAAAFLKSKYPIGFAKGDKNMIDVTRFSTNKGTEKEYVQPLDTFYGSPLSLWDDSYVVFRFTIVLQRSNIDQKLHDMYIYNLMESFPGEWRNGAVSRLIAHKRQWRVIVKLDRNISKFGCGWDEFVEDNDLCAGDICIFKLMSCVGRLFKVEIIRV